MRKPKDKFFYDISENMGFHSLFPLEESELRAVIKKEKLAPKGKLREFYCCRNNRELITKVARELFFDIIWDVIHGHSFYLPNSRKPFIYMGFLPTEYLKARRRIGFYKNFDLSIWNYKMPSIRIKATTAMRKEDYLLMLNGEFIHEIYKKIKTGDKLGGDKPKRIGDYLPDLYEKFAYISKKSVDWIVRTFLENFKLVINKGAKLTITDGFHWMLATPVQIYKDKHHFSHWRKYETLKAIKTEKVKKAAKENKTIERDVTIS